MKNKYLHIIKHKCTFSFCFLSFLPYGFYSSVPLVKDGERRLASLTNWHRALAIIHIGDTVGLMDMGAEDAGVLWNTDLLDGGRTGITLVHGVIITKEG